MQRSESFAKAFLDGFTMAGLWSQLRSPASADSLFAAEGNDGLNDGEREENVRDVESLS